MVSKCPHCGMISQETVPVRTAAILSAIKTLNGTGQPATVANINAIMAKGTYRPTVQNINNALTMATDDGLTVRSRYTIPGTLISMNVYSLTPDGERITAVLEQKGAGTRNG